ncbi:unnamed protein product [Ilex paraguariensis]|uniref:Uncharacterized protein n=1 Tax=Ilex paraguariensis TaxID=185542 RepID=A0ABC8STC3_9AQUA
MHQKRWPQLDREFLTVKQRKVRSSTAQKGINRGDCPGVTNGDPYTTPHILCPKWQSLASPNHQAHESLVFLEILQTSRINYASMSMAQNLASSDQNYVQ